MKNKIITLGLLALVPSLTFARFADDRQIPVWAVDAIDTVEDHKIMTGFGDGTFRPDQALNRAEAVTLLLRVKGIDASEYEAQETFSDVPEEAWFAPAVTVAVQNEWIKGFPDGTFKPAQELNRAEWAVILERAFEFETDHDHSGHKDVPSQTWFSQAVNALHANDMIRRKSTLFGPAVSVSRAEAAWQIAVLLGKPRLLGTSKDNDFSENVNLNSRRTAIRPRDFNPNKQGYEIKNKELLVTAHLNEEVVSFGKESDWVELGSFSIENVYDVDSSIESMSFRFPFTESGMGPADSFEFKMVADDIEREQGFTTTGKIFWPGLEIGFEPEETKTFTVFIRPKEGAYFFPRVAKATISISEFSGLTIKELVSTNAQVSHAQVKARITLEQTKIANIEFDSSK